MRLGMIQTDTELRLCVNACAGVGSRVPGRNGPVRGGTWQYGAVRGGTRLGLLSPLILPLGGTQAPWNNNNKNNKNNKNKEKMYHFGPRSRSLPHSDHIATI